MLVAAFGVYEYNFGDLNILEKNSVNHLKVEDIQKGWRKFEEAGYH